MFHIAAREGRLNCLKELCSDRKREQAIKAAVTASDQVRKGHILFRHAMLFMVL